MSKALRILFIYDQAGSKTQFLSFSRSKVIMEKYEIFWCDLRETTLASSLQYIEYLDASCSERFFVITGTSLNHRQWHYIWEFLRLSRIRSLCLIDSWQNIHGRFSPEKTGFCFSELILCIDSHVFETCLQAGIPESRLVLMGHSRLSELVLLREGLSARSLCAARDSPELLFISEPLFFRGEEYSPSKLTSLQKYSFKKTVSLAESLGSSIISLRLHPREPLANLSQFKQIVDGKITISLNREPIDSLFGGITFCAGLTSALLLELYFSGCPVVSFAKKSWDCELSFLSFYNMGSGIWRSTTGREKAEKCQFRNTRLINDNYAREFDSLLQSM